MKALKKTIALCLIAFLAAGFFAGTAVSAAEAAPYEGKLIILHSNDVHGEIGGYAVMKALADDYRAKGADVILADAGDFSQGNSIAAYSKGRDMITLMKMTGYDVVTLGNHEFDYGIDRVQELMAYMQEGEKGAAVISCNVLKDRVQLFDSSTAFEAGGMKVGFIGIETPEALSKSNPGINKGLDIIYGDALVSRINGEAESLRSDGCDIVIAIAHLGVDDTSAEHTSTDIWKSLEGVDFMIDGHSHTVMTEGPEGEPIQQTGQKFKNIGVIEIDEASRQITAHSLYEVTETSPRDAAVAGKIAEIEENVRKAYDMVVGQCEVELNGEKSPGNRNQETNAGDLVTDALAWYVTEEKPGSIREGCPVVALLNGGAIRSKVPAGEIKKQDIMNMQPFNNTLNFFYVTGDELLETLEASTYCTPEGIGGFPQVFGLTYEINIAKKYDPADETYPDSTYYPPKTIRRVTIKDIGGEPFDPEREYALITTDYVSSGGDTYGRLKSIRDKIDTGIGTADITCEYISKKLGGVVSAEQYGEPAGRILITDKEEQPEETVAEPQTGNIPDTADENNAGLWLLLIALSAAMAVYCNKARKPNT